jgi:hypothetical protein
MEQGVREVSDTMSRASNEATLILGKEMGGRGKSLLNMALRDVRDL